MSLISNFISNHLLNALESEFVSREPELQERFIEEVESFIDVAAQWVKSKIIASEAKS